MAKADRPMRLFSLVNVLDAGADESAQFGATCLGIAA
jgi:hypothetical protein